MTKSMTPKNAYAVHAYEAIAHRIAELAESTPAATKAPTQTPRQTPTAHPGWFLDLLPTAIPEVCEYDGAALLRSPEDLQGGAEILRCTKCARIAGMILTDGAYVHFPAERYIPRPDPHETSNEPTDDRGLIVGRWYWTRTDDSPDEWFPMKHDPSENGGWTNDDCSDDWTRSITEWKLIPLPEELP